MRYLIISDHKMKITLDAKDMAYYGLTSERTDYDDPKYRKIFWKILDEAKAEKRFDVGEERVLLQMYPKTDGGGELFVTKLGKLSPAGVRKIEESDRVTTLKTERLTYRFSDLDLLKMAARTVLASGGREESDVYLGEDGSYYLTVLKREDKKADYLCLCEYGDSVPKSLFPCIREHAEKLTEKDGIERFAAL